MTDMTKDVLIVGAGPVGLTLANDLLRRGIRCRLIDSAPHAMQKTKALGIHAKTQELFAKMGVAHTCTGYLDHPFEKSHIKTKDWRPKPFF